MKIVQKIRPHQLLGLGSDFGKPFTGFMPQPFSGSLMALENIVILKLINLIDPINIFEFGTYMGETTRLIIENLDYEKNNNRKLWTIDINTIDGINFHGNDIDLATNSLKLERNYLKSKYSNIVNQIYSYSMFFDPSSINEKMDFIFIDANHSLSYVKNDTEKSLEMISNKKSVIIWHDYENPQFKDLTNYLDLLSQNGFKIYHIEETMLAIMFSDDIKFLDKISSGSIFFK